MTPIPVNIAVEDELTEAIVRRLLDYTRRGYAIGAVYGRSGFGYLRKTIGGWNRAAPGIPFVVITDLDQHSCPPALISQWLPVPRHPNLIFRVAVREVESWLLADRTGLSKFLAVLPERIPPMPETLENPKGALVGLARHSRHRSIRERVVPKAGSTAQQGPDYNSCLREFVAAPWNVRSAARNAPSLSRALTRLKSFKPVWT